MVADVLRLFSFVALSLVLFYSRTYLALRGLFRGETFVLMLFALLGMQVLITANHFLTLYLGLELMSLSLYALVALQRDEAAPSEAAMKYFVLGALASGILLYGMSMIYGATGTLQIDLVAHSLAGAGDNRVLLIFGLVFVVSAIAFKLGAVPYHMWVPDVYQGAPTAITLLIGTVPEFAAFAMLLRLLAGALGAPEMQIQWQGMLAILALLSVTLGHVVAIAQTNLKRMLAYSTIANMGYVLMGFLGADVSGYTAAMFYILAYVMTSLVSFGMILLLVARGLRGRPDRRSQGTQPALSVVGVRHAAGDVLAGGHAPDDRLLRQAAGAAVRGQGRATSGSPSSACWRRWSGRSTTCASSSSCTSTMPVDRSPIEARGDTRWLLSGNGLALLLFGILPQLPMGLCFVALVQSRYF